MRKALPIFAAAAALASMASAQVIWIGPEIPVNSVTAGSQFAPSIATANDGGFLIAWQGVDASGFGIRARRFNADGTPATGEIAVNATTAGDQISPSVASFDDGRFVVAWAASGQDGSGFGIVARVLGANGSPVSAEIPVNSITAGNQSAPKIATPGNGSFLVLWTGANPQGDTNEIYGRGFAPNLWNPLTDDFRVNNYVSGHQVTPTLLRFSYGSMLAAWASEGQDGSGYGVFARGVDSEGVFGSPEFPIAQVTALDQLSPAIAQVAGGFVVAWQRSLQATLSEVGPQPIIVARKFGLDWQPASDEFEITPNTSIRHEKPALAGDAGGGFTVAWRQSSPDPDDDDKNVFAARFDPVGVPLSGAFRISTTEAGDQIDPVLAPGLNPGRFVAAWASFGQDGSSFGVFAQRFGQPCTPCVADETTLCFLDGRFRVKANYASTNSAGDAPAVALTDESGYFTFFDPENVELVVKAVDACSLPGFENFWIFATGLTNVQVNLTAEDTATCDFRIYHNDLNQAFQPILDTAHFQVCGAGAQASNGSGAAIAVQAAPAPMASSGGGCVADDHTLCLLDGRFAATIDYETALPSSGEGHAVGLTTDSGYFWFFDDANVEIVIKMVDGCDFNDRYWVYVGGLTDVGTHLEVRDTLFPEERFVYDKAIGPPFPPIQTIQAFATCP